MKQENKELLQETLNRCVIAAIIILVTLLTTKAFGLW